MKINEGKGRNEEMKMKWKKRRNEDKKENICII